MSNFTFLASCLGLLCVCSAYGPQKLGEKCDSTLKCETDLTCTAGYCNRVLPEGGFCGEKFWICAPGIRCMNSRCVKPVSMSTAQPGEVCAAAQKICVPGYSCVTGRCARVQGVNGYCAPPVFTCHGGLKCTASRCVRPVVRVAAGELCSRRTVCPEGYTCAGLIGRTRCFQLAGPDAQCWGKFTRCLRGLKCVYGKCRRPTVLVAIGGVCGATAKCAKGLSCVVAGEGTVCQKVLGEHGFCGEKWWTCSTGLECKESRCVTPGEESAEDEEEDAAETSVGTEAATATSTAATAAAAAAATVTAAKLDY